MNANGINRLINSAVVVLLLLIVVPRLMINLGNTISIFVAVSCENVDNNASAWPSIWNENRVDYFRITRIHD